MKILHIVTLMSPDAAYGGPVRVAVNQAAALRALGHDVVVTAAARGYHPLPTTEGDVPLRLFEAGASVPGVGYAGTRAPGMSDWLAENGAGFDVAHVHLARDLVAIPAARRLAAAGVPLVLQPHGMITPGSHPLAGAVDRLFTIRLLRNARAVLYLNDRERDDLTAVGGAGIPLRQLDNGVPVAEVFPGSPADDLPEVLFLARLHSRTRPEVFAAAALKLLRAGARARFTLVGPPEGGEVDVDSIIAQARAEGFGDALRREPAVQPDRVLERMARAAVYVLPAEREPFGMSIVEAISQQLPVVIAADGGLADFVTGHDCGMVVDGGPDSWATAIAALLDQPDRARAMGVRGRSAVLAEFGIGRIGNTLDEVYRAAVREGSGVRR